MCRVCVHVCILWIAQSPIRVQKKSIARETRHARLNYVFRLLLLLLLRTECGFLFLSSTKRNKQRLHTNPEHNASQPSIFDRLQKETLSTEWPGYCRKYYCVRHASFAQQKRHSKLNQHPVSKRQTCSLPPFLLLSYQKYPTLYTKDIVIGIFSILMASNRFRKLCFASKTNRKTPSIRSARVIVEFGERTRVRKRHAYKITEILRFAQETPLYRNHREHNLR